MNVTSMYPVLMSADVTAAADFYRSHFGFETTFTSSWYVSLRLGQWELAILEIGHPTIPAGYGDRAAGGVLVNLEVEDVDAVHDRLVAGGLIPVLPLRSEEFGQRHAIFAGPDGVLIDIVTPIPPTGEYVAQFADSAVPEAI